MLWIIIAVVLFFVVPFVAGCIYDFKNLKHVGSRHFPPMAERHSRYWFNRSHTYSIDLHNDMVRKVRSQAYACVGIVGGIAAIGLNLFFDYNHRIPEDRYTTLVSMNDAIGAKGRFFLGSGTIDTDPVYTYYWNDGNRFRLSWVSSSAAYITYSEGTPVLVHHGTRQGYSNWFSIGADDWFVSPHSGEGYEFKIPEGSIQQQYVLDAS